MSALNQKIFTNNFSQPNLHSILNRPRKIKIQLGGFSISSEPKRKKKKRSRPYIPSTSSIAAATYVHIVSGYIISRACWNATHVGAAWAYYVCAWSTKRERTYVRPPRTTVRRLLKLREAQHRQQQHVYAAKRCRLFIGKYPATAGRGINHTTPSLRPGSASPRERLPLELCNTPACSAFFSGRFSQLIAAMSLLTDLLNLDLSDCTGKIIAEYIW